MAHVLDGARVLITGGTGSFGECAVRPFLAAGAARVTIFSRDEYKQSVMRRTHAGDGRVAFALGDVRDQARLDEVMAGVDVAIHAAAMKHVDACEAAPHEAVLTNVLGSQHVLRACRRNGVLKAVNLSADKATMPAGVYGATKLLSERLFACASEPAGGRFRSASVRYSNVLGSRGSVVEVFRRLLRAGKPIRVFDPRMVRLVLTQDQVLNLVFYALDHMLGGEVFVKDSPALSIVDLAHVMVDLHGGGTVEVQDDAARAGEKYESWLFSSEEAERTLAMPDGHFVILPEVAAPDRDRYRSHHAAAPGADVRARGSSTSRLLTRDEVRALVASVLAGEGASR